MRQVDLKHVLVKLRNVEDKNSHSSVCIMYSPVLALSRPSTSAKLETQSAGVKPVKSPTRPPKQVPNTTPYAPTLTLNSTHESQHPSPPFHPPYLFVITISSTSITINTIMTVQLQCSFAPLATLPSRPLALPRPL